MKKNMFKVFMIAIIAMVAVTSCKPYQEDIYVEVAPNETAFVIPLEENTKDGQEKLKSEKYLDEKKVVAKRIYVPTQWHKTGRMWYSGDYIPSVRVIKVNRAPVTREWTSEGTGTNGKIKEDIDVESKESIGFGIGITATASIPEKWASRFLYSYNGKSLAKVMDDDVRAYIQNILTSEFGIRDLSICQSDRKTIYDSMRVKTIKHFAEMGVDIINIGAAGGFAYIDPEIQKAINDQFASEKKVISAQNEVDAANKFVKAKNAIEAQKKLDADILIKQSIANRNNAMAEGFKSGKLQLPKVVSESIFEGVSGLNGVK